LIGEPVEAFYRIDFYGVDFYRIDFYRADLYRIDAKCGTAPARAYSG